MKRIFYFFAALVLMAACQKEQNLEKLEFAVSVQSVEFTDEGGEKEIDVTTNGEWKVSADEQKWYTVEPVSGNGNGKISIAVQPYEDAVDRVATVKITVSKGGETQNADILVRQGRKPLPDNPSAEELKFRAWGGVVKTSSPEGYIYEIKQETGADWVSYNKTGEEIEITVSENTSGAERREVLNFVTSENEKIKSVTIIQSDKNLNAGDFLIEEIFFTSTLVEATGKPDKYHGDQYVKITNNTDELLYADGIMFMEAKINSALDHTYVEDIKPEYCGVQAVYVVPGSGKDVPVEPGKSILIANNAQNHNANNSNSFDLTVADFEWYDESSSSSVLDIDNPEVPNLDKWFCYTKSIWIMHDRGFYGYCIAIAPTDVNKDSFLSDYKWEGKYINHTPAGDFEMNISNAYKVPNSWVLDAVNLSVEEVFFTTSFDSSLDAGYAHCGKTDKDPERYGKSVIRKKDADGKLVDTNNSTSDFVSDTTPSMAK